MGNIGQLGSVKDRLIKDLKESTLSFADLGKRYGVSRQAVFEFAKKRGIRRPKRSKIEHTKTCSVCRSIIRIAKKPHSDFISSRTIKNQLRLGSQTWVYHVRILKKKGIVSAKFGRLQSQKVERAYQLYFKKRLPVGTIGKLAGLKNFNSVIKQHRVFGWDVPAPFFKYDSKDRSRTALNRGKRKKRKRVSINQKTGEA